MNDLRGRGVIYDLSIEKRYFGKRKEKKDKEIDDSLSRLDKVNR